MPHLDESGFLVVSIIEMYGDGSDAYPDDSTDLSFETEEKPQMPKQACPRLRAWRIALAHCEKCH